MNAPPKLEVYQWKDLDDIVWKPSFRVIFGSPEGQKWPDWPQNRISSEDWPNECSCQVRIEPVKRLWRYRPETLFFRDFGSFSDRQKIKNGPIDPKIESVLKTGPMNAYAKFEVNQFKDLDDIIRKPLRLRTAGRRTPDGQTDGQGETNIPP